MKQRRGLDRNVLRPTTGDPWGVEQGRCSGVAVRDRKCFFCDEDIGDEFHYILSCSHFRNTRRNCIKRYFYENPNVLKFNQLMNTENPTELRKLCMFIKCLNDAMTTAR